MPLNYIRLALRSLGKDKIRAMIEVFGLSVGLACCLLIMLFVSQELSFDRFHARSDDIYRVWVKEKYENDRQFFNSFTPVILAETMGGSITGIERAVRVGVMNDVVSKGETSFIEIIHLADPAFFEVFDFDMLNGDRSSALADPHGAVLTEDFALRLFGDVDVIGETFSIRFGNRNEEFRVSAITAKPPSNSSIRYDVVVPFAMAHNLYSQEALTNWFSVTVESYLLLSPGVDPARVEAQFPGMLAAALGDQYERSGYTVGLQPLTEIHLDPEVPKALATVSDPALGCSPWPV